MSKAEQVLNKKFGHTVAFKPKLSLDIHRLRIDIIYLKLTSL